MIEDFYLITEEDVREYISYHKIYSEALKNVYTISDDKKSVDIKVYKNETEMFCETKSRTQIYRSIMHYRSQNAKQYANTVLLSDRKDDAIIHKTKYEKPLYTQYKNLSKNKKKLYNKSHIIQRSTWSPKFIYNHDANIIAEDIVMYNNNRSNYTKINIPNREQLKNDKEYAKSYQEINEKLQKYILKLENDYKLYDYNLSYNECSIELLDSLKSEVREQWIKDNPATKEEFEIRYPNRQWPLKNKTHIREELLEHWFTFDILRCLPHSELYITYLDIRSYQENGRHKYTCPCWTIDKTMDYLTQVTPTPYFIQHGIDVPYWDNVYKTFIGGWTNKSIFYEYFQYKNAIGWLIEEMKETPDDIVDYFMNSRDDISTYISNTYNVQESTMSRMTILKIALKELYKKYNDDDFLKQKLKIKLEYKEYYIPVISINKKNRFAFYKKIYNIPDIPIDKLDGSYCQVSIPYRSHFLCIPEYMQKIIYKSYEYVVTSFLYLNAKTIQEIYNYKNEEFKSSIIYEDEITAHERGNKYNVNYFDFLYCRHKILIKNSLKWRGVNTKFDEYLPVLTFKQHRTQKIKTIKRFNNIVRGGRNNYRYVIENLEQVYKKMRNDKLDILKIFKQTDIRSKTKRNLFTRKRKKFLRLFWKSGTAYKKEIYELYKEELLLYLNECKSEIQTFIEKYEDRYNNKIFDIDSNDIFDFKLNNKNTENDNIVIYTCIPKKMYLSQGCFDYINKLCKKNNIIIDKNNNTQEYRIRVFLDFVYRIYTDIIDFIQIIEKDNNDRKWLSKIDRNLLDCIGICDENFWYINEDGVIKQYRKNKFAKIFSILKNPRAFNIIKKYIKFIKIAIRRRISVYGRIYDYYNQICYIQDVLYRILDNFNIDSLICDNNDLWTVRKILFNIFKLNILDDNNCLNPTIYINGEEILEEKNQRKDISAFTDNDYIEEYGQSENEVKSIKDDIDDWIKSESIKNLGLVI